MWLSGENFLYASINTATLLLHIGFGNPKFVFFLHSIRDVMLKTDIASEKKAAGKLRKINKEQF